MGRIVFLNPFPRTEIGGGIKTTYRHAELLAESGLDVAVFQPDGAPAWFRTALVPLSVMPPLSAEDVLVFPEILHGEIGALARAPAAAKKVLFCQNQYYMMANGLPADGYAAMGFSAFATTSAIAKGMMERVLHLAEVSVLPCFIDPELFYPRAKSPSIALVTRKMEREAALINAIFTLKYAQHASIPWDVIGGRSEAEAAEAVGRASILLSLSSFESLGLVPLEAMASGAIIVGFHGEGGLEYATPENGSWFASDHLEEVADCIAATLDGLAASGPALDRMREAGFATAARFGREAACEALLAFYGPLVNG